MNVDLNVTFYSSSGRHSGNIVNISEKGMFISTNGICFPIESQFEVVIPFKDGMLHVPSSLRRIEMSPGSHDGIGLEIRQMTAELSDLLGSIRTAG